MIAPDVVHHPLYAAFPLTHRLPAGESLALRPLQPDDTSALLSFFRRIPVQERGRFFPDVAIDPVLVTDWCRHWASGRSRALMLWSQERIVAAGAIDLDRHHLKAHVGKLRLVVDRQYRRHGLGHLVAKELLDLAPRLGLAWINAELGSHELGARCFLESLRFQPCAVLPDHGRDMHGATFDILILARQVGPHFAAELGGRG